MGHTDAGATGESPVGGRALDSSHWAVLDQAGGPAVGQRTHAGLEPDIWVDKGCCKNCDVTD